MLEKRNRMEKKRENFMIKECVWLWQSEEEEQMQCRIQVQLVRKIINKRGIIGKEKYNGTEK